ncbi:hypothetical protein ACFLVN_06290, partial [Chloroflexota bacterium]
MLINDLRLVTGGNLIWPYFISSPHSSQPSALTHNKSYRKMGSCVRISVTEGGKGDTTQHYGIRTGTRVVWEASDRLCSKRLQPFLPEMLKVLRKHGEQIIDVATEGQLYRMSPSTIDWLLRPHRRLGGRR